MNWLISWSFFITSQGVKSKWWFFIGVAGWCVLLPARSCVPIVRVHWGLCGECYCLVYMCVCICSVCLNFFFVLSCF